MKLTFHTTGDTKTIFHEFTPDQVKQVLDVVMGGQADRFLKIGVGDRTQLINLNNVTVIDIREDDHE